MVNQGEEFRARMVRAFDTFTCGVLAGCQHKIVFVNQKLADMLGRDRHELWGSPIYDLVPQELRDALKEDMKLIENGDLRARLSALMRSDGTSTPILVFPMTEFETPDGDLTRFDILLDLGAVMTAKHMLYEGEEQLRSSLSRIAIELQTASLLAGGSPAAHPELDHRELRELSKREREVLALLVKGDRVPGIAKQLFISPHTVRNHLKSMFRKLGVGSQAELIDRARELH